jgi:hypothetical protein
MGMMAKRERYKRRMVLSQSLGRRLQPASVLPDEWRTEMRKVITGAFVSLDGVMQAPGGPKEDPTRDFKLGGWVVPYMDEVFGQAINEIFGQPFELLLGRKTYEIFAAHSPATSGRAT